MSSFDIAGDLRAAATEQRREKEHRVKYRGVNAALIGHPIRSDIPATVRSSPIWTESNKFRMREALYTRPCHCQNCRRSTARDMRRKCPPSDMAAANVICTAGASSISRKQMRPRLNDADAADYREQYYSTDDDELDATMAGVEYSFDHAGPTHELDLSYAVTQAVEKFEAKELATLIKNEYEFVDESDTDEEFELI